MSWYVKVFRRSIIHPLQYKKYGLISRRYHKAEWQPHKSFSKW